MKDGRKESSERWKDTCNVQVGVQTMRACIDGRGTTMCVANCIELALCKQ